MGEYARSAAIARAALERWPSLSVHFMLSRAAPYAADAPFPTTLLASSATFHSAAVIDLIRAWRPHVVIFDNAGRGAQLRAARRLGAHVVYISARARQRRKAFRLRWMRLLDEHWIAYPEFVAGKLGPLERAKLRLLGRPVVRFLDVILSRFASAGQPPSAHRSGGEPPIDVLVIPGGGTDHPGAGGAVQAFRDAARSLAASGFAATFVGPPAVPQSELAGLMRRARLIVVNGGSTLLQAIACGAPCVAVPIARDQRQRIRRCVRAGVAVETSLDPQAIAARAVELLKDEATRSALAGRAAGLALTDGVETALCALERLLDAEGDSSRV